MTQKKVVRSSDADGPKTRGGWTPVGTAAARRAARTERATARGDETRQKIVAAARRVFERDGFFDVRVGDITREAGLAHGSFYTYFASKRDAFVEVMVEVGEQLTEAVAPAREDFEAELDAYEALDRSHRRYLEHYRQNSDIHALIDQVASGDPEIQRQRRGGRRQHIRRVARTIERWQQRGLADPEVEPDVTAAALVSMLSNFAYWWFAGGERYDEEHAVLTLTDIWARAVGLGRRGQA